MEQKLALEQKLAVVCFFYFHSLSAISCFVVFSICQCVSWFYGELYAVQNLYSEKTSTH